MWSEAIKLVENYLCRLTDLYVDKSNQHMFHYDSNLRDHQILLYHCWIKDFASLILVFMIILYLLSTPP